MLQHLDVQADYAFEPPSRAVSEEWMRRWADARGLTESNRCPCLASLEGRLCRRVHGRARWLDHPRLFNKNGRPAVLVGQPYHLDYDDLQKLAVVADDFDVVVAAGPSWHYPGGVVSVLIARKDLSQM